MSSLPQDCLSNRKKKYEKPSLKIYGNIQTLTASVDPFSETADGGISGTMVKTH